MSKKKLKRIKKQIDWLRFKLRYAKTEAQKNRFERSITKILTAQAFDI